MTTRQSGGALSARGFRHALWALALAAGCAPEPGERPEVVRPVKTMVVVVGEENHVRVFPGRVEAARKVEMAFQVPGILAEFPVKEGQKLAKGDLIGQLRQDEFKARLKTLQSQLDQSRAGQRALQAGDRAEQRLRLLANVRAAEARMANALTERNRYASLLRSRAVAAADFDMRDTAYRVAKEEHAAAVQLLEKGSVAREEDLDAKAAEVRGLEARVVEANLQLKDSTLRAPYDGVIAQRFVERGQNIPAKAPVVRFQDVDEIEIAVDIPEVVMAADVRSADVVELIAEFSAAPGLRFPVQVREVAQTADPTTQTFRMTAAMKAPAEVALRPGMTATVTMTYRRASILGEAILVPSAAISKEPTQEQVVWTIDKDQTARRRPVKLGEATGSRIVVTEGLQPGERIAVAGVSFLREGMRVRDLGDELGGGQP